MILVPPLTYVDWLRWRELGIGSSDASTIMGASPWETPLDLWKRRTNRLPRLVVQTDAMRRGLALEPDARAEYERITGIPMPKQLGIHHVHDWLRASFDGYNAEAGRCIEIKCPGRDDHKEACEKKRVPAKYVWQLVHLLLVSDLPVVDYVSYDKHTVAIVPFRRNLALESRLIKAELRFWQCVVNDVPPPSEPEKLRVSKSSSSGGRLFRVRQTRGRQEARR